MNPGHSPSDNSSEDDERPSGISGQGFHPADGCDPGVASNDVSGPGPASEPVESLAALAAARLAHLAENVRQRRPTRAGVIEFDLEWTADPAFQRAVDAELKAEVGRGVPSVYEFSACDVSSYDSLRTAFEQRPRTGPNTVRELRYSRLMKPSLPRALYVGSGSDLPARVGQHLGRIGGAGTYSMRLALWAADLKGAMLLRYWTYPTDLDPIELEVLEQELWDACTPLLGKRSGR